MHVRRLNRPVTAAAMVTAVFLGVFALVAPTARATGLAARAVRAVDPAALDIVARQHVTLAQAETRLSWQQRVPTLTAELRRHLPAAKFGGIWIAPNDGDRVKVGVVGLRSSTLAVVTRAVHTAGLSAATDLVPVRYGLIQLVHADTWLSKQLVRLSHGGRGSNHLDVSYRTDLNRVQLGVAGHNLTTAERVLVTHAKARYGHLVQVVAQPVGSVVVAQPAGSAAGRTSTIECVPLPHPFCNPSLRAGIYITNTNRSGATSQCTAGFIAASRIDGKLYQFTAGHCVAEGGGFPGTWWTKFPDGSSHAIGAAHNYVFGKSGDEAILNINNPSGWMLPQGWVYVMTGPDTTLNEEYPISSAQYSTQGARICYTGAASVATNCGTVLYLGVPHCEVIPGENCIWVYNLGEASFCAQSGDSGAPVYASHQAFGLVVAKGTYQLNPNKCVTYYQGIIGASNAMHVNIVRAHKFQ